MRRNGKLTILILDERVAYYIKGEAKELTPETKSSPHNSKLNLKVEQVFTGHASAQFEPGTYLSGGVAYYNPNWAQKQQEAEALLRELRE